MTGGNGNKRALHFTHPPQRVVSLVPSLTESLFDLGLGDSLIGVTDYCTEPAKMVERLPRIGGTKNPRVEAILALKPDLILANQEENTKEVVENLESQDAPVWLTFPKTVREAMDVLWTIVGLFNNRMAALRLATLEQTLDWVEGSSVEREKWRYFCPIWQETGGGNPWWMTFNQDTYPNDVLRLFGGENIFAGRERRYPLEADLGLVEARSMPEKDTRYPHVTYQEILAGNPQVIILLSEPYPFGEEHKATFRQTFAATEAVQQERIILLDGSLITWHGTRLGKALNILPALFEG